MQERGKRNLYRAIDQLPTHRAPERVWAAIERVLDAELATEGMSLPAINAYCAKVQANREAASRKNQAVLRRAVEQLPQYSLPRDVFEQIAADPTARPRYKSRVWYWTAGIAASLALLVAGVWYTDARRGAERVRLAYSEETIYPPDPMPELDSVSAKAEVLQFVHAHCALAVLPCQAPEFRGLLTQYQELEVAKKELELQIRAHREQPQLVWYLVRVEKEQTEVGKRLIQYLRI